MKQKNMILKLLWIEKIMFGIMGQRKVNMAKIRQVFTDIPFFLTHEKQVVTDAHYMGYLKGRIKI